MAPLDGKILLSSINKCPIALDALMKRIRKALIVVFALQYIGLILRPCAQAQTKPLPLIMPDGEKVYEADLKKRGWWLFNGTVVTVNPSANTFTAQLKTTQRVFTVTEETKITGHFGKKLTTLKDVRIGEEVGGLAKMSADGKQLTAVLVGFGKATDMYPFASPVPGRPGFVTSPYAPTKPPISMQGFPKGAEVRCPYTGKFFLNPL